MNSYLVDVEEDSHLFGDSSYNPPQLSRFSLGSADNLNPTDDISNDNAHSFVVSAPLAATSSLPDLSCNQRRPNLRVPPSPIRPLSLKETENQLKETKAENFNLKVRIFHLEKRLTDESSTSEDNEELFIFTQRIKELTDELNEKDRLLKQKSDAVENINNNWHKAINKARREEQQQRELIENELQMTKKKLVELSSSQIRSEVGVTVSTPGAHLKDHNFEQISNNTKTKYGSNAYTLLDNLLCSRCSCLVTDPIVLDDSQLQQNAELIAEIENMRAMDSLELCHKLRQLAQFEYNDKSKVFPDKFINGNVSKIGIEGLHGMEDLDICNSMAEPSIELKPPTDTENCAHLKELVTQLSSALKSLKGTVCKTFIEVAHCNADEFSVVNEEEKRIEYVLQDIHQHLPVEDLMYIHEFVNVYCASDEVIGSLKKDADRLSSVYASCMGTSHSGRGGDQSVFCSQDFDGTFASDLFNRSLLATQDISALKNKFERIRAAYESLKAKLEGSVVFLKEIIEKLGGRVEFQHLTQGLKEEMFGSFAMAESLNVEFNDMEQSVMELNSFVQNVTRLSSGSMSFGDIGLRHLEENDSFVAFAQECAQKRAYIVRKEPSENANVAGNLLQNGDERFQAFAKEIERLENILVEKDNEIHSLKTQNLNSKIAENENNAVEDDFFDAAEGFQMEIKELQTSLANQRERNSRLEDDLELLRTQTDKLLVLVERNQQQEEMRIADDERRALSEANLKSSLETMENELEHKEKELEEIELRNAAATENLLSELHAEIFNHKESQNQVMKLNEKVKDCNRQIDLIQDNFSKEKETCSLLKSKVTDLHNQLDNVLKEKIAIENILLDKDEEICFRAAELDAKDDEIKRAVSNFENYKKESESEIEKLSAISKLFESKYEEVHKEYEDAKIAYVTLKFNYDQLNTELKSLQAEMLQSVHKKLDSGATTGTSSSSSHLAQYTEADRHMRESLKLEMSLKEKRLSTTNSNFEGGSVSLISNNETGLENSPRTVQILLDQERQRSVNLDAICKKLERNNSLFEQKIEEQRSLCEQHQHEISALKQQLGNIDRELKESEKKTGEIASQLNIRNQKYDDMKKICKKLLADNQDLSMYQISSKNLSCDNVTTNDNLILQTSGVGSKAYGQNLSSSTPNPNVDKSYVNGAAASQSNQEKVSVADLGLAKKFLSTAFEHLNIVRHTVKSVPSEQQYSVQIKSIRDQSKMIYFWLGLSKHVVKKLVEELGIQPDIYSLAPDQNTCCYALLLENNYLKEELEKLQRIIDSLEETLKTTLDKYNTQKIVDREVLGSAMKELSYTLDALKKGSLIVKKANNGNISQVSNAGHLEKL